jgi:hypothetical protein
MTKVFVSYSRADEVLVRAIVQVIRSVGADAFQDVDSIPYGKLWRAEIERSIEECEMFLLFWCEHSASSSEVTTEYQQALQKQKTIVPALLDETALAAEIDAFQAIDLRSAFFHLDYNSFLTRNRQRMRDWCYEDDGLTHVSSVDEEVVTPIAHALLSGLKHVSER